MSRDEDHHPDGNRLKGLEQREHEWLDLDEAIFGGQKVSEWVTKRRSNQVERVGDGEGLEEEDGSVALLVPAKDDDGDDVADDSDEDQWSRYVDVYDRLGASDASSRQPPRVIVCDPDRRPGGVVQSRGKP